MPEIKWENWEDLENLPMDQKKDLVLWMLTTQDSLVAEVETEHAKEIEMKKLLKENEELRKTLKSERSKATRERNKLTKELDTLKGIEPTSDEDPAPAQESTPEPVKTPRKARKARTVKAQPAADLKPEEEEPEEDDTPDLRNLKDVPAAEQQPVRQGATKMAIEQLQTAIANPTIVPWHKEIAQQEMARRNQATPQAQVGLVPLAAAPVAAAPGDDFATVKNLMTPGQKMDFNELMAIAVTHGVTEDSFLNAITQMEQSGVLTFPETDFVMLQG